MEPLVTAITFNFSHDASFASSLLEEAGIHSVTEQNNTNIPGMNKEISIKVFKRDYDTARKIFEDHGLLHGAQQQSEDDDFENRFRYDPKDHAPEPEITPEPEPVAAPPVIPLAPYPNPNSANNAKIPTWTIILVVILVIRIFLFAMRHCN